MDTTNKKTNFLSACVANATALKAARDVAKALAEELSNDVVIAGIIDGDCTGYNSHLTRTVLNNYLQVVQPLVEADIANHINSVTAMIPS